MTHDNPFDDALDKVAANASPRAHLSQLTDDEQHMVRMAQLLSGTRADLPDREFKQSLQSRLIPRTRTLSRRSAVLSSIATMAAGLIAGIGLDRSIHTSGSKSAGGAPLVGSQGSWTPVARLADLPNGAVHAFSAGAIQGFVVNHNGELRAVSRICTHMGCALTFKGGEQHFVCPCHGAEFDVHGRFLYGANGQPYALALPPLPQIAVRTRNDSVEVWTV